MNVVVGRPGSAEKKNTELRIDTDSLDIGVNEIETPQHMFQEMLQGRDDNRNLIDNEKIFVSITPKEREESTTMMRWI